MDPYLRPWRAVRGYGSGHHPDGGATGGFGDGQGCGADLGAGAGRTWRLCAGLHAARDPHRHPLLRGRAGAGLCGAAAPAGIRRHAFGARRAQCPRRGRGPPGRAAGRGAARTCRRAAAGPGEPEGAGGRGGAGQSGHADPRVRTAAARARPACRRAAIRLGPVGAARAGQSGPAACRPGRRARCPLGGAIADAACGAGSRAGDAALRSGRGARARTPGRAVVAPAGIPPQGPDDA